MRRLALVLTVLACFLWSAPALGTLTWHGTQMYWEATGTLQCEDVDPVDVPSFRNGEIASDGEASSETYQVYNSADGLEGTLSCGNGYHGLIRACEIEFIEVAPGVEEGCQVVESAGDRKALRCWISPVSFSTGLVIMTFHGSVKNRAAAAVVGDGLFYILAQCTDGGGAARFEIPISVVQ